MKPEKYTIEHFASNILCSHAKSTGLSNVPLHLHNHFEINLYLEGDVVFFIDGNSFKPTRGNLIIINNTQIHGPKIISEKPYERAIIHFSPSLANSISTHKSNLLECFKHSEESTHLVTTLSESDIDSFILLIDLLAAVEDKTNDTFGDDILVNAYLSQLLVITNRSYLGENNIVLNSNQHFTDIVQAVLSYIQTNITSNISLDTIEKEFAVNKHYLNRLFKKQLGISIYNYFILSRVSLAKKLLHKGLNPNEVSHQLGYNDYSTFARSFKKITGFSPSSYVESIL